VIRVFPVFSATFAVLYVLAMNFNLALFTYFPRTHGFGLLAASPTAESGVAMYWYGWLLTASLGSVAVAGIALLVPDRLAVRVWSGWSWLVPAIMVIVLAYLLRSWFLG
jgi:hypothetical protein